MKRKIFSMILVMCLILSSAPLAVIGEGEPDYLFQLGEQGYNSIADVKTAAEAVISGGGLAEITLLKDFTLDENLQIFPRMSFTIASGVKLIINQGIDLIGGTLVNNGTITVVETNHSTGTDGFISLGFVNEPREYATLTNNGEIINNNWINVWEDQGVLPENIIFSNNGIVRGFGFFCFNYSHLVARWLSFDGVGVCERTDEPDTGTLFLTPGNPELIFYLYNYDETAGQWIYSPVLPQALSATGSMTIETLDPGLVSNNENSNTINKAYYTKLRISQWEDSTISYTFGSLTYELSVYVGLPEVGFYKAPARSTDNYIDQFTYTPSNNTFYSVVEVPAGFTLTEFTGSDDRVGITQNANVFTLQLVENTHGEFGYNFKVKFQNTDDSSKFYYSDYWLSIYEGEYQRLVFKPLDWDNEGPYINDSWGYDAMMYASKEDKMAVALYMYEYDSLANSGAGGWKYTPISISDPALHAAPGINVGEVTYWDQAQNKEVPYNAEGLFFTLEATDFGYYSISYTIGEGAEAVVYQLPILSVLPQAGYYRAAQATQENYLSSFEYTDSSRSFYFVVDVNDNYSVSNIQFAEGSEYVTISQSTEDSRIATITLNEDTHQGFNLRINATITNNDNPGENYMTDRGIFIQPSNAARGLQLVMNRRWDDALQRDVFELGNMRPVDSYIDGNKLDEYDLTFAYGTPENYTVIPNEKIVSVTCADPKIGIEEIKDNLGNILVWHLKTFDWTNNAIINVSYGDFTANSVNYPAGNFALHIYAPKGPVFFASETGDFANGSKFINNFDFSKATEFYLLTGGVAYDSEFEILTKRWNPETGRDDIFNNYATGAWTAEGDFKITLNPSNIGAFANGFDLMVRLKRTVGDQVYSTDNWIWMYTSNNMRTLGVEIFNNWALSIGAGADYMGADVISYGLRYTTSDPAGQNFDTNSWINGQASQLDQWNNYRYAIIPTPNTTYYYQSAVTVAAVPYYGEIKSFTTPETLMPVSSGSSISLGAGERGVLSVVPGELTSGNTVHTFTLTGGTEENNPWVDVHLFDENLNDLSYANGNAASGLVFGESLTPGKTYYIEIASNSAAEFSLVSAQSTRPAVPAITTKLQDDMFGVEITSGVNGLEYSVFTKIGGKWMSRGTQVDDWNNGGVFWSAINLVGDYEEATEFGAKVKVNGIYSDMATVAVNVTCNAPIQASLGYDVSVDYNPGTREFLVVAGGDKVFAAGKTYNLHFEDSQGKWLLGAGFLGDGSNRAIGGGWTDSETLSEGRWVLSEYYQTGSGTTYDIGWKLLVDGRTSQGSVNYKMITKWLAASESLPDQKSPGGTYIEHQFNPGTSNFWFVQYNPNAPEGSRFTFTGPLTVAGGKLTASNGMLLRDTTTKIDDVEIPVVGFEFKDWGDYTLTYAGEDGNYSMPVRVQQPDISWYSEATASGASKLDQWMPSIYDKLYLIWTGDIEKQYNVASVEYQVYKFYGPLQEGDLATDFYYWSDTQTTFLPADGVSEGADYRDYRVKDNSIVTLDASGVADNTVAFAVSHTGSTYAANFILEVFLKNGENTVRAFNMGNYDFGNIWPNELGELHIWINEGYKDLTYGVADNENAASMNAITTVTFADGNYRGYFTGLDCATKYYMYSSKDYNTVTQTGTWSIVEGFWATTIPHSFSAIWSSDLSGHWHECVCGDKADFAAHTWGDWVVTTEATNSAAGSKEHVCSVCGYKEIVAIPALGVAVTGVVNLGGREAGKHGEVTVKLTPKAGGADIVVTTNAAGEYSFATVPLGDYTITIEKAGYLSHQKTTLVVGQATTNSAITLKGGDINGDGQVTAGDLSLLLGNYLGNTTAAMDINGDGQVTSGDLALLLGNYLVSKTVVE